MTDVAAGWQALAAGRWKDALALFRGADHDPEALEGMGLAYWWLDDADATLGSRERAFRLYREARDALGAARVASALAWDSTSAALLVREEVNVQVGLDGSDFSTNVRTLLAEVRAAAISRVPARVMFGDLTTAVAGTARASK